MRFHWWDYVILGFLVAFWAVCTGFAYHLVGLFSFIGGDFAQFWAAARAIIASGPGSAYDQVDP